MAKKIQLVVFSLDKEFFGVDIASVQEIVRVPNITRVPDAPPFLEGVINLRGKIVPVLNLRNRLGLISKEKSKASRVLVAENRGKVVGLLVDGASEVIRVSLEEVEAPPEIMSAIGIEYITGVAKVQEKLIILLELKKIMDLEDIKRMKILPAPLTAGEKESLSKDTSLRMLEKNVS